MAFAKHIGSPFSAKDSRAITNQDRYRVRKKSENDGPWSKKSIGGPTAAEEYE